jgi:hypothetical protein
VIKRKLRGEGSFAVKRAGLKKNRMHMIMTHIFPAFFIEIFDFVALKKNISIEDKKEIL